MPRLLGGLFVCWYSPIDYVWVFWKRPWLSLHTVNALIPPFTRLYTNDITIYMTSSSCARRGWSFRSKLNAVTIVSSFFCTLLRPETPFILNESFIEEKARSNETVSFILRHESVINQTYGKLFMLGSSAFATVSGATTCQSIPVTFSMKKTRRMSRADESRTRNDRSEETPDLWRLKCIDKSKQPYL